MELRHLRYFIAVAERLHFAQAAEALGIAPPTLTVQIQEMERALQAQLFRRTRRSVALTPAGEAFLVEARETIAQFERTLNVGQRAGRGELGRIHIGYVGSAAFSGILQKQLRAFRKSRPHVLVQATEHPMGELPALLEEGRVDVAFVRLPVDLPSSLRAHVLVRDAFCVALPAEHPLAAVSGSVKARSLAGENFVVPEQDLGTREVARRGRFSPRIVSAPGTLLAVLTQVSVGVGVAIVPNLLTRVVNLPNVVFKTLAGEPIVSEVAAVYRKFEHSPATKKLIAQITGAPDQ
ncbi:LysR substrate-binding domain-containing protein [Paraburkholderia sabiae]|uniref:LysR substrate-binding domain-containing protein n=1 Tax=Paraburkholderia sabiae TaxID=273251 RepID=A0ABU9QHW7_9BURK|nr:LysR substrate-binding domain-containing protein [Paraburkholderia sabiae]WJZ76681.1 LysR substrate-binding domain-containing protein [Paraburkholderia sabiae]CAD6553336.1 Hca operon transcriptional activator HcaR [Paraburkholderia sabiae]